MSNSSKDSDTVNRGKDDLCNDLAQAQAELSSSAQTDKIDVVGRLRWLEDLARMIQSARNDFNNKNSKV